MRGGSSSGALDRRSRRTERRSRQRQAAVALGVVVGVALAGCSPSSSSVSATGTGDPSATTVPGTEPGGPSGSEADAPASTEPDAATPESAPPGTESAATPFEQRAVIEVLPPEAATDHPDRLRGIDGLASYELGPVPARHPALVAATVDEQNGRWMIRLSFAPGADGIDLFNEQMRPCFEKDATCPTGMMAIVVDGVVVSAPRIQPDQATFTPFEADQINISGSFTEAEARALAERLSPH